VASRMTTCDCRYDGAHQGIQPGEGRHRAAAEQDCQQQDQQERGRDQLLTRSTGVRGPRGAPPSAMLSGVGGGRRPAWV
jgi:hypothetical protein